MHEYLSTGKIYRFNPDLRICNAVVRGEPSPELRSGCLRAVSGLMEEWPEFSGAHSYPVPHPNESPDKAFHHAYPKGHVEPWERLRRSSVAYAGLADC